MVWGWEYLIEGKKESAHSETMLKVENDARPKGETIKAAVNTSTSFQVISSFGGKSRKAL